MNAMVETWDSISFNMSVYRETGVHILSAVDEIQAVLEDQIVKTQTMRGSPFIKPFDKEIRVWWEKAIFLFVFHDNYHAKVNQLHYNVLFYISKIHFIKTLWSSFKSFLRYFCVTTPSTFHVLILLSFAIQMQPKELWFTYFEGHYFS